MMRDDPQRCLRLAAWLHWLWWSMLAAGVCMTLMVLSVTLLGGSGLRGDASQLATLVSLGLLTSTAVAAVGVFTTVARESRAARRAQAATVITTVTCAAMGTLFLLVETGSQLVSRDVVESLSKLVLAPLAISAFAMFVFGVRTFVWIALRTDRFSLWPQTNRYAFLSTLWHGLMLALVLGIAVSWLLMSIVPGMQDIVFLLGIGWFVSWFGHAGWMIYSMVAIGRVLIAVRAESKVCRKALASTAKLTGAPA